jgi:murein DD-endopeptidase MepM/ murein hydrolase activator NlpD
VRSYSGGIRHDYKDSASGTRIFNPRGLSWFAVGLLLPVVGVILLLVSEPNESMVPTDPAEKPLAAERPSTPDVPATAGEPTPVAQRIAPERSTLSKPPGPRMDLALLTSPGERVPLTLPPLSQTLGAGDRPLRPDEIERSALLTRGHALNLRIERNDTLDRLFRRNDLSVADLAAMVALPEGGKNLAKIKPGDKIEIIRDGDRVLSLSRDLDDSERLWIKHTDDGFVADVVDLQNEIRTAGAHGVIQSSLWNAAAGAGLDQDIIGQIAGIFAWDVDFLLDIRAGDSFTVVYEEVWRDGVKLHNGDVIAAEFVNQGDTYRAARYINPDDPDGDAEYYTPDGLSVRRAFLRAPLDFTRVSSNFSLARKHPILNTIRAHKGVDYAAPTGTPVKAAGDGKIIARGLNGSYGNRVEIQHGGNISTLYAHLSKFGSFRVGDHVKQGQIIGYVGMTGSATGPHLHYEYRVNGVHRNPRTVDLPDADPIARQYLADFQAKSATYWHQLDLYEGTLLASNSD